MPVRAWISGHTVEGQVARRVEAVFGEPPPPVLGETGTFSEPLPLVAPAPPSVPSVRPLEPPPARIESPGRLAGYGSRLGAKVGLRLDPGRRGALAVGAAALVAVVLAGGWVLLNRPHAAQVGAPPVPTAAPASPSITASAGLSGAVSARSSPSSIVVVDVVGKVVRPGVYQLPAGSRVDDAVKAAGGALPGVDLSTVNLAQLVSDGQQIAVAVAGAPAAPAAPGSTGAGGGSGAPVNLNTASSDQLDALPGVGPVLAQHILAWRQEHGRFTSIDQLREVSGIGEAKFDDLRPLVTV